MNASGPHRRLGIDVGKARVGVAVSDPHGMLASPVETVQRDEHSVARIVALAAEYEVRDIFIGLPINLRGEETASTVDARVFAAEVEAQLPGSVVLIDERLSTVSAHSALRASGKKQKNTRSIVDQVAAVVLLQHALDSERQLGKTAGRRLSEETM